MNTPDGPAEHNVAQRAILQFSVLVAALCGIAYQLIIATVSSYLLGNSVYQFSITIGLFMFAMGLGSFLSKLADLKLLELFLLVEIGISLVGGLSSSILFVVFPYTAFYRPVMYLLIVIIGTLVGLEIPLLTRIFTQGTRLRDSIAHVLTLDYLGALIGSISFPILLLPLLGLFRSSFSIGLLNLAVTLLILAAYGRQLRGFAALLTSTIAVGVVLTAGMIGASSITAFAEGQLFTDQIIFRRQSQFQRILVTRNEINGTVSLYLDGHIQFAGYDEYRYHEALVHPLMSAPGRRSRVLVLGGGDGLGVREILKYQDVESVDLVDIDPEIIELCSNFPPIRELNQDALGHPKVQVHVDDAFNFVRNTTQTFDRVVIDLPDPHNEALGKLYSVEFYRLLRRCVSPAGLLATQSTSPFFTREAFWSIVATLEAASYRTHPYQVYVPSFGSWGFVVAAASGDLPQNYPINVDTRFLTTAVMATANVFGKDLQRKNVPTNSIFEPKLYQLYQRGLRR